MVSTPKTVAVSKERHDDQITGVNELPQIDGITLRWVNPASRNRSLAGWKCWIPVNRESEIGEQVAEHIKESPFRLGQENQDGAYFWRGDMVLAYAPKEKVVELRKRNVGLADTQLSHVIESHKTVRRVRKMSISRIEADDDE